MPGSAFLHAAFGTSLLTPESVILDVNEEFCRMLGYDADELVGRNLLEIVHPDDHGLIDRIHGAMRRGELDSDQTRRLYVRKDGETVHAMAGVTAVRDDDGQLIGIIKQIQDISRRVRAERELHESLARQRVVIDSLADGLLVFDADGRIRVTNPSAEDILGVSGRQLRARLQEPLVRIIDEDGQPVSRDAYIHLEVLRTGRPMRGIMYRIERPDGESRWVRANAQPLVRPGGEEPYVVVSFADVTALKERERELVHHALHDPLTDLPNRRYFLEHLGRVLAGRRGAGSGVLYIDLDGFKRVNDRFGHGTGDRLLVEVSRRMARAVHPGDVLARLAGDEFGALLSSTGSSDRAVAVARAVIDAMDEPFTVDGITTAIRASVGVTMVQQDDEDPKEVLDRADASLRRAKEEGKGRLVEFSPAVDQEARRLVQLERDLPYARERGELSVEYTPILSLSGGGAVGEKAGLHWQHPQFGVIPPERVRRLVRDTGLAQELQKWVIREAVARLAQLPREGAHARLFLSVVPELLVEDGRERFRELLGETGVEPGRLVLAVHAADDAEDDRLADVVKHIGELGVGLMLEASGEGRTRSRRAVEFPYHWIGVHPVGIGRTLADSASRAMMQGVLDSLREVGVRSVAETDGSGPFDLDTLRGVGFEYALGRPIGAPSGGGVPDREMSGTGA